MPNDTDLLSTLDHLERLESPLLSWGYVDGGFTEDEVIAIAESLGADDGEDVLEELLDRHLVVRLRVGRRVAIRTRSSETIRLLARLRQLFPKHARDGSWRNAPTLVSDFRYTARPRSYPARSVTAADALATLSPGRSLGVVDALTEILEARGSNFRAAKFQIDATARVLDDLSGNTSRATIIGAGTGSGKTLAFYLPALAHVADQTAAGRWTKVLAVYPRNELLKDQFSETYAEARHLDQLQARSSRRKITIGAFFGPTPYSAQVLARSTNEGQREIWRHSGVGFVCPFLRCPHCSSELIWQDDDVRASTERLVCTRSQCGTVIDGDEVILTRSRMRDEPPDLLFTTTEMLNRQLADTSNRHVFGVGPRASHKPALMLLDEVHTYEGTTGAQAAFVIRRWRHAVGRPVQFVGLSATLREAHTFFSTLTGVPDHAVTSISPASTDLVSEGMEYLIALRGDPVSGTSLLSTSIQAAMLIRRTLDLTAVGSFYGSRLFCFTDDLDVTNRLYFDLLDAEGRNSWGNPDPQGTGPLAALRSSVAPEHSERLQAGQSWDLCEAIGHHLDVAGSLRIGRTSSQDPGVMATSDVVVATASLDVGFNDPSVGAVLQHKAPRGAAQFLQRKGRAGRVRGMRPWTAVVLSDYGRDRLAYQGYELLFDPELESRSLPLGNTYVVRIQAAFAFLDWLATKLPSNLRGSVWTDLAGPAQIHQPRSTTATARQAVELEWIERALTDPTVQADLLSHVARALRLSDQEVAAVAWDAPRALLLHVLPTIRRRLKSGWSRAGVEGADYQVKYQPLPEFVPANLFSDLSLPETQIVLPPDGPKGQETETQAPILQALRTFAPGRVSRRYGVEHRYVRHWVPIPLDAPRHVMELEPSFTGVRLGEFEVPDEDGRPTVFVGLRPWTIRTERPPRQLLDASNSTFVWRSKFDTFDSGDPADVPSPSPWDGVIADLRVFAHGRRSGLHLTRIGIGNRATALFQSGAEQAVDVSYEFEGHRAALGFDLDVDGIRVDASVPPFFEPGSRYGSDEASLRGFRTSYFQHLVTGDPALLALSNEFKLQWVAQLFLSFIIEHALEHDLSLDQAVDGLSDDALMHEMQRVLTVVFEAGPAPGEEEVEPLGDDNHRPRLHRQIAELLEDPGVVRRLRNLSEVLWQDPDEGWQRWATERFAATLGTALLEAVDRLCRDVGADALLVDISSSDDGRSCQIWLSEPSIGGGGIIEEFARRYATDPRRFFRLVRAALGPSDFEIVDSELTRILDLVAGSDEGKAWVAGVRSAQGNDESRRAMLALVQGLDQRGVATSHPVVAAMNARVLRPGSSPESDAFLRDLIMRWRAGEAELGVEIDARVFAYLASASDDADKVASHVPPAADRRQWRFRTIYGLLWPRGFAVRAASLQAYNPFAPLPLTDRKLVLSSVPDAMAEVDLDDPGWREAVTNALVNKGGTYLRCDSDRSRELRHAIVSLQADPIDAGYLLLHPRVVGFERRDGQTVVALELREAYQ